MAVSAAANPQLPAHRLVWSNRIADLPQDQWDALAVPLGTPFLEWHWLHNLESSGSAVSQEGWLPNHLTLWRGDRLVAAAVLYVKGHSYGEFVFDHQWAELSHRLGLSYYPKLVGMTPFTPAEGYRFLVDPEEDEAAITGILLAEIDHFCDRNRLSGCHFLFVDPAWRSLVESQGYLVWKHHSYIWSNPNYQTFEDYLGAFNANQRRNIKRECKAIEKAGLVLRVRSGDDIPHGYFPKIYDFYSGTCDKFWGGSKYLTRTFFKQLYGSYRDRVVLVTAHPAAYPDEDPIALSFCIRKGDRLYGRYWGTDLEIDALHFNACYYKPIEWAIAQGIKHFDPGAGGRHKRRRGFPATPNYSLHRLYSQRLRQILTSYIEQVNELEQQQIDAINQDMPFSQTHPDLGLFLPGNESP
jgi:predicted N-acyltransferase